MIIWDSFYLKDLSFFILIVESIIVFVLLFSILLHRLFYKFRSKRNKKDKKFVSELILQCIKANSIAGKEELFKKYSNTRTLLKGLEGYNSLFKHNDWKILKTDIAQKYLLPYARKITFSFIWTKRNFAARCFFLAPLPIDEIFMIQLLNDPVFLVYSNAALALVQLDNKEGIVKTIKRMSEEKGYSHFFLKDILVQNLSRRGFLWVEELALNAPENRVLRLTCLELFCEKECELDTNLLESALSSDDEELRLAAIKVYARNIQPKSKETLLRCIDDPNEKIRAEAAFGLKSFKSPLTLSKLSHSLKDPAWIVREQSARTLKEIGKEGIEILKQQTPEQDRNAYEVANYILKFDW